MQLLMGLQQAQSPSAEGQMLVEASIMINAAYARIAPRSAKAAGHLATANKAINQAREALESEGSRPLAGPPDLGMAGMAPGTVPQGPPGGMGPGLGLPGGM